MAKGETYEQFVEKFKPKKTTDDCYTPPLVYEAVKGWACREYGIDPARVVRPFWPGGDYERFEYPEGCAVIDNPPLGVKGQIAVVGVAEKGVFNARIATSAEGGHAAMPSLEDATAKLVSGLDALQKNPPASKLSAPVAAMLREREEALGRPLYLISDEPYREITYGIEVPWVPSLYARTIVCYSYSKALSLPGERIGWVYVSDSADDGDAVAVAVAGAGRALGYVCAPVLLQRVAARCVGEPSDVAAYAENRRLLTEGLSALGYEYVEPDGAFYLWVRALEEDAQAFSDCAKEYELLIVPSDSFGVGGWVRLSYCIARDTIERSMPAFKALKESYEAKLSS